MHRYFPFFVTPIRYRKIAFFFYVHPPLILTHSSPYSWTTAIYAFSATRMILNTYRLGPPTTRMQQLTSIMLSERTDYEGDSCTRGQCEKSTHTSSGSSGHPLSRLPTSSCAPSDYAEPSHASIGSSTMLSPALLSEDSDPD